MMTFRRAQARADAKRAADSCKRQTLGQELAEQLGAGCAERSANRDFFLACGAAGEQKIGDIGASDQQNEADRAEKHPQRAAYVTFEEIILQGFDGGAPALV